MFETTARRKRFASYRTAYTSPEEVEISVTRYEPYSLEQTVTLRNSRLGSVNGHPRMHPDPSSVRLDSNLTINIESVDLPFRQSKQVNRTTSVNVWPRTRVASFEVQFVGPTPAELGGVSFRIKGAKGNPPPLKKLEGFKFQEKSIPITFKVRARPYRLASTKGYVLPIEDDAEEGSL
jgi:hypothetical protein